YTFSRDMTTDPLLSVGQTGGISSGDQNRPGLRYGPDFFVREHRFIANWRYQLPGPKNPTSVRGQVFGGSGLAGVTTLKSGHKLLVLCNPNGRNVCGQGGDRASLSGACKPGRYLTPGPVTSNLNAYINAKCFVEPSVFGADDPNALGFGNS